MNRHAAPAHRVPAAPSFGAIALLALFAACVAGCASTADPAKPSPDECAACHMEDFRSATHPPHVGVRPTKCAVCHTSYSWRPSRLDHPFPLEGAHAKASCFDCHKGNPPVFEGTKKECVACHRADYDRSRYPNHSHFPLTCEECHSVSAWKPPLPSFVPREEPEPAATTTAPSKSKRPAAPQPAKPRPTAAAPAPKPAPAPLPVSVPHTAPAPAPVYTPEPAPAVTQSHGPTTSTAKPRPDTVSGSSRKR